MRRLTAIGARLENEPSGKGVSDGIASAGRP